MTSLSQLAGLQASRAPRAAAPEAPSLTNIYIYIYIYMCTYVHKYISI